MGERDHQSDAAVRSLTERDREILRLVLLGMRTKEIARELKIAPDTIDHRVSVVLR